jgi:hypothetical protein
MVHQGGEAQVVTMTTDSDGQSVTSFSASALLEWTQHVEHVLRGVVHALNNRAAALSAAIELSSEPDDDPAVVHTILGTEMERVRELTEVIRAIGVPRDDAEAFVPRDVVPEVLGVLQLHAEQRERTITIDAERAVPIRAPRWMFVRALIAMSASAPPQDSGPKTVRVTLAEDGEWMIGRVEDAPVDSLSLYAAELSRAMGGEPLETASGFRIPTLAALRRREGR